jgi:N-acetylmuramoyl-L-alanine amidase
MREHGFFRCWSMSHHRRPLLGARAVFLTAAALLCFGRPAHPAPDGSPRVTGIERYASEKAARIVLTLTEPVRFVKGPESGRSGAELQVDLHDATYSGLHAFDVGGLVHRVRLLQLDTGLRVALDVSAAARHEVFFLPEPFRVVIDVSRPQLAPLAPPPGRRLVERIALDPGHGGSDPGATGHTGIREKDIVLDIAHRAAPLLARELGVSTLLTRDGDVRVPLEERVARANAFGADLFVSIHCNADASRGARGVMTFVLDGSHDHRTSDILLRENASPPVGPREFGAFLQQFDDAGLVRSSLTFARLLQRSALASLSVGYPDAVDGGVQGAGFYVLAGARMPAVLFETSFVSNALEAERLATERYRQKLADAIVNAVRAYRAGY